MIDTILQRIQSLQKEKDGVIVVGIDGPGGAGKSTVATTLHNQLPSSTLIHGDHFYKTANRREGHKSDEVVSTSFDWDLLEKKVFTNLQKGTTITFQPYSWDIEGLLDEVSHNVQDILLLEGVYTLQDRFFPKYDLTIWVDSTEDERKKRGIARDGSHMEELWETLWIPQDKRYKEAMRPHEKADIVYMNT